MIKIIKCPCCGADGHFDWLDMVMDMGHDIRLDDAFYCVDCGAMIGLMVLCPVHGDERDKDRDEDWMTLEN